MRPLARLPTALPFLVLVTVLFVRGSKLVTTSGRQPAALRRRTWPARVPVVAGIIILGFLCLLARAVGADLPYITSGLITALMLLLGLLVRVSGQVSLCHSAFAAIGAVALSQFLLQLHVPWLAAVLLAALLTVPIGALVAIPAIRLSGVFLALATFGFGLLVQQPTVGTVLPGYISGAHVSQWIKSYSACRRCSSRWKGALGRCRGGFARRWTA